MRKTTIKRKILLWISGSVAILISICALFVIDHIKQLTQDRVETDVMNQVLIKAEQMKGFFREKAATAVAMSENEFMLDWFTKNDKRGAPIEELPPNYDKVMQTFKNVLDKDPEIVDAYFASHKTREYFSHNDQRLTFTKDGKEYDATQRPWYLKTRKFGKIFVSDFEFNNINLKINGSIQNPVTNRFGEFIGISGIDIDVSTIARMIDNMKYENVGDGFLLNREGKINYWPLTKGITIESAKTSLADVQRQVKETSGLDELERDMINNSSGVRYGVIWKGEAYVAVFHVVKLERPYMDFVLALMIPEQVMNEPINRVIKASIIGIILIIFAVSAVVLIAAIPVLKPINEILLAMKDIAQGEGDLTKRLTIKTNDEISELAETFNEFVTKIQSLVKRAAEAAEKVASTADKATRIVAETDRHVQRQKSEVEMVATSVTEMTSTVNEISRNAQSANQSAVQADKNTSDGKIAVEESVTGILQLATRIDDAASVVDLLQEDSEKIGAVIEVIENIAAQTNLLALNAAIEAARAGEQGRGFAVVADEVRTLANKTQESTENIYRMIETLRERARDAVQAMGEGSEAAHKNVKSIQVVAEELKGITESVDEIQQMSLYIATATEEQSTVTSEVGQNVITIRDLADENASASRQLLMEVNQLSDVCFELQETVQQFKV